MPRLRARDPVTPPGDEIRQTVMQEWGSRRAKEIKDELKRLEIDSDDCFEKSDLLERLVSGLERISQGLDPNPEGSKGSSRADQSTGGEPHFQEAQSRQKRCDPIPEVVDLGSQNFDILDADVDIGGSQGEGEYMFGSNPKKDLRKEKGRTERQSYTSPGEVVYVESVILDPSESTFASSTTTTHESENNDNGAREVSAQAKPNPELNKEELPGEGKHAKPNPPAKRIDLKDKQGFVAQGRLEKLAGAEAAFGMSPSRDEWRSNDMLVVELQLPNAISGKFIIDTSSPQSILSEETARRLGHYARDFDIDDDIGKQVMIDQVLVEGTPVGRFSPVVPKVQMMPLRIPGVIGILGLDFLAQYDVDLDFYERKFSLFNPGMLLRHNPTIPGGRQVDMEVGIGPKGMLFSEVKLFQNSTEGPPIPAVIDTALPYTICNWPAAKLLGASEDGSGGVKTARAIMAGSDGKPVALSEAPIGVRFQSEAPAPQPVQVSQRVLTVGDIDIFDDIGLKESPVIRLGMDVLADSPWVNRISLSFALQRMRVCVPA